MRCQGSHNARRMRPGERGVTAYDKNLDGRIRVKKTLIFDREQVGVEEGIGECVAAAAEL